MRIPVLNPAGDRIFHVHQAAAIRMLEKAQVKITSSGRALQLIGIGQVEPAELAGRTHTSRGGLLAAIGRSQEYTTANGRGQVDGFKTIYPEDRDIFRAAILDCLVS